MTNEEIMKKAHELGLLLKDTDEMRAADAAEEAFESDEALQGKIAEYSAQQESLAALAGTDDKLAAAAVQARIDALYNEIINDPRYTAYSASQQAVAELMAQVNEEINFAITGRRGGCSGDCGSCGGCH